MKKQIMARDTIGSRSPRRRRGEDGAVRSALIVRQRFESDPRDGSLPARRFGRTSPQEEDRSGLRRGAVRPAPEAAEQETGAGRVTLHVTGLSGSAAVMAVTGWSHAGVPSLADFKRDVAGRVIRYYMLSGGDEEHAGGASPTGAISAWVRANFSCTTVRSTRVYQLAQPG